MEAIFLEKTFQLQQCTHELGDSNVSWGRPLTAYAQYFWAGHGNFFLSLFRDAARWPGVLNHLYILYRGEKMRV